MEWTHLEFVGLNLKCKNGITPVSKPSNLEIMIRISKQLSKGILFVRVDLYNIEGKVYLGELTFYPDNGIGSFTPRKWNYRLGELLHLPNTNINISKKEPI